MARDVRFLKQCETCDASAGKLMPHGFPNRMEMHFLDQALEQIAQRLGVGNRARVAMMSFDNPLATGNHAALFTG